MSGRCKACNSILEEWEMKTVDPLTGTYTELCDQCVVDIEPEFEQLDLDLLIPEDIL